MQMELFLWSVSITATFIYDGSTSRCISCSPNATSYSSEWKIQSVSSNKSGNSATASATANYASLKTIPKMLLFHVVKMVPFHNLFKSFFDII